MLMDKDAVKKILPHREPISLVDTVEELEPGKRAVTTFYVDPAMEIFKGHFPGNPVFPGVYSVECISQAAGLLMLTDPRYAGTTPLFLGINDARFKRMVVPGDTLVTHISLVSERADKAIATCAAESYVNGALAVTATVTIAMR